MKRVRNGVLYTVLYGVLYGVLMAASAAAQTVSLPALEAQALERHPAVREAAAAVEVARARASQSGAWENPVIGGGLSEWRPRETPSGTVGGFVEQTFALGGKRSAERAAASSEVAVREADLEATRLRVTLGVRTAYYEMASAAEKRSVAERLAAVTDESVVIAKQLMNVGLIDRQDVLEAEAEAARQRALLAAARVHEAAAWRRLAVAVADPSLAAQPIAPLADAALPALDRQASLDRVLATSPELKAAQAAIARERSAIAVEQRRTFPDLTLRGEVGWNRERFASRPVTKGWEYGVEAGISLPLFNRNRHGVFAAQAGVTVAEAAEAVLRLDLESRFADAFEAYEQSRLLAEAYKADILPRLQESMSLYQTRYREMASPYPQVLMAQRLFIEATGEYLEALDAAWQAAIHVQGLVAAARR